MFRGTSGGGYSHEPRWDSVNWNWRLGTVDGIRVKIHIVTLLFALYLVATGFGSGQLPLMTFFVVLGFGSILLHEFGHCYGARYVGGEAHSIILWPLGGLARNDVPQRPGASFLVAAAGPAVNLVICSITLPFILPNSENWSMVLNPFGGFPLEFATSPLLLAIVVAFKVNWWLLLLNLLPLFPMDGGAMLQAALWYRMGYLKSMTLACDIGFWGGIGLAAVCLWFHQTFLAIIAVLGVVQCYLLKQQLRQYYGGFEQDFGYDFSQGQTSFDRGWRGGSDDTETTPRARKSWISGWATWRAKRQQESMKRAEQELDRILEKISAKGMASLTRAERKMLQQASKKRQQRAGG